MGIFATKDVYNEVRAQLATFGSTLVHDFGSEALHSNRATNSYVWVPLEIERTGGSRGGPAGEWDALCETTQKVDVWCFGQSHEVSIQMAFNVLVATFRKVPSPAIRFLGIEFEFPKEGEPMLGLGRAAILHLGFAHAFIPDHYVAIAPHQRTVAQEPVPPDAPVTEIEAVEATTSLTQSTEADGAEPYVDLRQAAP